MKKIIRLTESDLVRLVKRVIKEQSPYAPGMAPKTTTPAGVNPTNKSSIKYTGEFKTDVSDEFNKKEFEKFIKSQSGAGTFMQGNLYNFVPISNKVARVNNPNNRTYGYVNIYISKENLPNDINTNPCYSNLKLDEDGDLKQVDVKISCKKEYQKLVYIVNKQEKQNREDEGIFR